MAQYEYATKTGGLATIDAASPEAALSSLKGNINADPQSGVSLKTPTSTTMTSPAPMASPNLGTNIATGTTTTPSGIAGMNPLTLQTGVGSSSAAFGMDVTTLQDLQKKIQEAQTMQQQVATPSVQTTDLQTQLQNLRLQEQQYAQSLSMGQQAELGKPIPLELATGRAQALQKQAGFQQQTYALQEQSLLNGLGLSQEADKAAQERAQYGVTTAQTAFENQQAIQQEIRTQQNNLLDTFSKYTSIQRNQAADILDSLKGVDPAKMSPDTFAQLSQIAKNLGISPQDLLGGLSVSYKSSQADALLKQAQVQAEQALANQRTSGETGVISFTPTQLNKGAANAGIPIATFKTYSDDAKNYFVNNYSKISQFQKSLQTDFQGGEDPTTIETQVKSQGLPTEVESFLVNEIWKVFPKPKPTTTSTKAWWEFWK